MIDPVTLTAQLVAILTPAAPYLKKAAESAAAKIGEAAWKKAQDLYAKLQDRFTQDNNSSAEKTLDLFVEDPETFESALSMKLLETLEKHPEWAKEIGDLLADPKTQEVLATNNSTVERIAQSMKGSAGTQRVQADDHSKISDVKQSIE